METSSSKKVKVSKNGPYLVSGNIPLNQMRFIYDRKGASTGYKLVRAFPAQSNYALCRCGGSGNKPFCDGSHLKNHFNGTETAGHKTYSQMAEFIEGNIIDLYDAKELCAVARFCDTHGSTWNLVTNGTVPETADIAIEQCENCPSGRLTAVTKDGKLIEPELPQEISVLEDEAAEVHGPLWVKGGITIEDEQGKAYPVRNRVTLCRCGKSRNKPFCDASHMQNRGETE